MKKDKTFRLGFHPFLFLMGYNRISIPTQQLEAILNLCRIMNVRYRAISLLDDRAQLCVPFFSSGKLLKEAKRRGLSPEIVLSGGLPSLIIKHRARAGIFAGIILSVVMIILSGNVIWDIRVDGESQLCEEEVEAVLEECGLWVGIPKSRLEVDVIENRVLILSDSISWISINLRGTVANVEIREIAFAPDDEEPPEAANLVSDAEGVIVRIEDARGNIVVDVGEAVSRGQLLVGGIYGDEENPFRYTSAKGKVFAECEESFSVNIQRKYQKKIYSNDRKCEKYLIFFKNEIKFFGNSGNSPATCDKIETVEYLRSPSGHQLPVGIKTVTYREYSYAQEELDDNRLSELANYRLRAEIAEAIPDAEILGISTSFELSDEGYRLTRKVRCIRNIAVRQKIDIGQ